MRLLVVLGVVAILTGACAGTTEVRTDTRGTDPVSPVEKDFFDFLVGLGATDEEARCVAVALADGASSTAEVDDRTADYDTFANLIDSGAPGCVSPDRVVELEDAYLAQVETSTGALREGLRESILARLSASSATPEEAECVASTVVSSAEVPPLYVGDNLDDSDAEIFRHCAPVERLRQIFQEAYTSPIVEQLAAAGATRAQATCIVESIDSIDLFLPSDDFHGSSARRTTAEILTRDAAACASQDELRSIALAVHSQYQLDGSDSTSGGSSAGSTDASCEWAQRCSPITSLSSRADRQLPGRVGA